MTLAWRERSSSLDLHSGEAKMKYKIIGITACLVLWGVAGTRAETAVTNAWVRASLGSGAVTAGYAVITNSGPLPDRLLAVSSPDAARVELHQSSSRGGVMTMSPVENLVIPAAGRIELKPGDYHLMILQLRRPIKAGETLPLRFQFERVDIDVVAKVAPLAATSAPAP